MNDIDELDLKLRKFNTNTKNPFKFKVNAYISLKENLKCEVFKLKFLFQIAVEFETIKSDIFCIEYSDKLFISITSTGKFGSIVSEPYYFFITQSHFQDR
jgi:hypothetical protein